MSSQNIEQFLPPIQSDGLNTAGNASIGGTLAVTGAATFSSTLQGGKQSVIDATAATTLTAAQSGSVVLFDSTTGFQIKLPASAAGLYYEFVVVKRPTSGTIGIVTPASSFISGALSTAAASSTAVTYVADGSTNTVVSMNGTTTGGSVGTVFTATCLSSTLWSVSGISVASGALATPIV